MKKRLVILLLLLACGVGILSDITVKVNEATSKQTGIADTEIKSEIEVAVNGPVNIVWDESGLVDIPEAEAEEETEAEAEVEAEAEPEAEPEPETQPAAAVVAAQTEPEPEPAQPQTTTPVYREPTNNIKIAGRTLEIVDVDDTGVDAGDHVNRYKQKFLYGHNSDAVFGALKNVGVGSKFTVTENGVTKTYTVAKVVIFDKNRETGRLELNGKSKYTNQSTGKAYDYMNELAKARFEGEQYSLSIMTCHGTAYANRDAAQRYVIFAN